MDVPDAPVFATLARAQINLSLPDLLRGRYVVESGSVDGVDVHYFVDEQGRDNLPRPLTDPNKPNEPLNYLISALKVSKRTDCGLREPRPADRCGVAGVAG